MTPSDPRIEDLLSDDLSRIFAATGRDVLHLHEYYDGDLGLVSLHVEVIRSHWTLEPPGEMTLITTSFSRSSSNAESIFLLVDSMLIISRPDHNSELGITSRH